MKLSISLAALAFSLSTAVIAHATIIDAPISYSLADGGTLSGDVFVDSSAGVVTNYNVTVKDSGTYLFTAGNSTTYQTVQSNEYYFTAKDVAGDYILIGFPEASLVGFNGSSVICVQGGSCSGYPSFFMKAGQSPDFVASAAGPVAFTPFIAATPEPSSLVLLGTGILGFAGAARRRFARA